MNILYIARSTLFSAPGGDTIQILKTAETVRKLGVAVDVKLTNQVFDYDHYDLLHFFNIIRPADILVHIKKSNKPYVVSPIYVNYSEYDSQVRGDLVRYLHKIFNSNQIEYFKTIARFIFNNEKIGSFRYLYKGQSASIKYIMEQAKCLLPNSHSEYRRLSDDFYIDKPYVVVPNAVDPSQFNNSIASPIEESARDTVLCVARLEGLKNQLNLIEAMNGTAYKIIFIGKPAPNHLPYYKACRLKAKDNIKFINQLEQEQLPAFYKRAKVHALTSWFETTGLSSLEAAAMGCNIVITDKGDQKEYFKDFAYYCDPNSPESIREQIELAFCNPVNPELRNHVLQNYTWDKTAEKTLEGYKIAIGNENRNYWNKRDT